MISGLSDVFMTLQANYFIFGDTGIPQTIQETPQLIFGKYYFCRSQNVGNKKLSKSLNVFDDLGILIHLGESMSWNLRKSCILMRSISWNLVNLWKINILDSKKILDNYGINILGSW